MSKKKAFFSDYIYYESTLHKNSYLLTDADKIIGITADETACADYEIKRYKNSAIFPCFINTHNHLAMSLFRGFADDLPLMDWLNDYIWKVEKKYLSDETVYIATLLSAIEMIHSGTSTCNDMYFYPYAIRRALDKAKVRGVVGFGAMGSVEKAIKGIEEFKPTKLLKPSLCPHALYTVGKDNIKILIGYARDKNILIHTHLSETLAEVDMAVSKYGKRPVYIMDEIGGFDTPSIFAHCVHLTDDEISLMGKKAVNISHCIDSNLKLASGIAPISKLITAGANITIGTDSAASNNDISMLNEINTAALVHKATNMSATTLPAKSLLDMSTKNAATALQIDNIGTLAEDKQVDFFVLSFDSCNMTPVYNPISHLVYSATNNDITDMYIAGREIMSNRTILTVNEDAVKEEVRKIAADIKL